jgi:hypothetical protein
MLAIDRADHRTRRIKGRTSARDDATRTGDESNARLTITRVVPAWSLDAAA